MQKFHKNAAETPKGRVVIRHAHNRTMSKKSLVNSTNITEIKCDMCHLSPLLFIRKRFQEQYNQSERFFYVKDVDDLISSTVYASLGARTKNTIRGKDLLQYQQIGEFFADYTPEAEFETKMSKTCEYYRYYKDLPRHTMEYFADVARKHYEKHRVLQYKCLKSVLGENHNFEQTLENGNVAAKLNEQKQQAVQQPADRYSRILTGISSACQRQSLQLISAQQKKSQKIEITASRPQSSSRLDLLQEKLSQMLEGIATDLQFSAADCSFQRGNFIRGIVESSSAANIRQKLDLPERKRQKSKDHFQLRHLNRRGEARIKQSESQPKLKKCSRSKQKSSDVLRTLESPNKSVYAFKKGRIFKSECNQENICQFRIPNTKEKQTSHRHKRLQRFSQGNFHTLNYQYTRKVLMPSTTNPLSNTSKRECRRSNNWVMPPHEKGNFRTAFLHTQLQEDPLIKETQHYKNDRRFSRMLSPSRNGFSPNRLFTDAIYLSQAHQTTQPFRKKGRI